MKRQFFPLRLALALLALLCLWTTAPALALPDPGAPGPYPVTKQEYNFGNSYDTSATFPYTKQAAYPGVAGINGIVPAFPGPVEFIGSVWYPSTAAGSGVPATGKKFPLIVFLHGRHSTAYNPTTGAASSQWPPVAPNVSIPSYEGYDYAGPILASYGYVVVSISANGINAVDNNFTGTDRGMIARAQLIQAHLDFWKQISTTGQTTSDTTGATFGTKFVGVVDMTGIGLMGHSRGGEGIMTEAVYNADTVNNPEAKAAGGPAYPIKAVLPIAPVDYNRYMVNNIPIGLILPYCDGDVSDNQGMHFYDDARYRVPTDQTPKYFMYVMGADHDFFNIAWTPGQFPYAGAASGFGGAADDWEGTPSYSLDPFAYYPRADLAKLSGTTVIPDMPPPAPDGRLSPTQQQGVGLFYITAFFRTFVGGETQFLPYLKGDVAPPPSALGAVLQFAYQAPPSLRLDVNSFLTPDSLTVDAQNGSVSEKGLTPFSVQGSGLAPELSSPIPGQPAARQPGNTPSLFVPSALGLSQLSLGWSAPGAYLENDLPVTNVSGYYALQFRAAVNFVDYRNVTAKDDFSVVLTDATGKTASVSAAANTLALNFPPGRIARLPKIALNMVRLPLTGFTGVDLTKITSVKFVFDKTPRGSLLITDLAFADTK